MLDHDRIMAQNAFLHETRDSGDGARSEPDSAIVTSQGSSLPRLNQSKSRKSRPKSRDSSAGRGRPQSSKSRDRSRSRPRSRVTI